MKLNPSYEKKLSRIEDLVWSEQTLRKLCKSDSDDAYFEFVCNAVRISESDMGAYYASDNRNTGKSNFPVKACHYGSNIPENLSDRSDLVSFLIDCRRSAVLLSPVNENEGKFLNSILLDSKMKSGLVLPVFMEEDVDGLLFLNSKKINHYGRCIIELMEGYSKLSSHVLIENEYALNKKKPAVREGVKV